MEQVLEKAVKKRVVEEVDVLEETVVLETTVVAEPVVVTFGGQPRGWDQETQLCLKISNTWCRVLENINDITLENLSVSRHHRR